jgi:hypothetical protein
LVRSVDEGSVRDTVDTSRAGTFHARVSSGWSRAEACGEKAREALLEAPGLRARLLYDCHRDARKLDVELEGHEPEPLVGVLSMFGAPHEIAPGALTIIDREGYFRLYVVPSGLRVTLRKAAPPRVVAELLGAVLATLPASRGVGPALDEARCEVGALTHGERGPRVAPHCTRCLACTHAAARRELEPPAPGREDDEADDHDEADEHDEHDEHDDHGGARDEEHA